MEASLGAELLKLRKRRAVWSLVGAAVALLLVIGYALPYARYLLTGDPAVLGRALPDRLAVTAVDGDVRYVGVLAFVLGVLSAGGEYGWTTLRTALVQRPSRTSVLAGKVVALGVVNLVLVLAMFAAGAAAAALVAAAVPGGAPWPPPAGLTRGIASGWLILQMWTVLGALAGIALRGVAVPVGLGAAWLAGVETLLPALAHGPLAGLRPLRDALPGANAGALVAALGRPAAGGERAALVVTAYLVAAVALGVVLLRRRDVT